MSALTPCPQGIEGRTATGTVRQQVSQSVRIIWQVAASCDTDGSRYFYGWQQVFLRMAASCDTDGSRYFQSESKRLLVVRALTFMFGRPAGA